MAGHPRSAPQARLPVPGCVRGHMDSAAIGPTGRASHPRTDRPSAGKAARSIALCPSIRRRFVLPSPTITHTETLAGRQPNSATIRVANLRFRSTTPTSSLTSAIAVLSSITQSASRSRCQATRSTTPRSPKPATPPDGAQGQTHSLVVHPAIVTRPTSLAVSGRLTEQSFCIMVGGQPSEGSGFAVQNPPVGSGKPAPRTWTSRLGL